jgi:hypothetical protein
LTSTPPMTPGTRSTTTCRCFLLPFLINLWPFSLFVPGLS